MTRQRVLVAALTMSAMGFIGLVSHEGYVDKAMVPTQGDRPTVGFGSTFHIDGSPVKMGDSAGPVRALVMAQAHISKQEAVFRKSLVGGSLSQAEFDIYMDFTYQYGEANWSSSSMRRHILAGNYREACESLLLWKKAAGYDCSTPGNKRCWGVWERQLGRYQACLAAQ